MTTERRPCRWWSSVRVRITALAVLAAALVLSSMSVLLLFFQRDSALGQLDEILSDEAESIGAAVAAGTDLPPLHDDDRVVVVYDADHAILHAVGPVEELAAERIETPDDQGTDRHVAGELHRVVSEPFTSRDGRTGWVLLAEPRDELDDSVERLMRSLVALVPGAVVALGVLVWFAVGRTLRPVERVRAEVAAIGIHELDHRVPVPSTGDEIARLAGTMNSMLDRIEHAVRRQRQFIGDASHELRSPLARVRARFEIDEQQPGLADPALTRRHQLVDLGNMQALIDDLMLLAQGDDAPSAQRTETIDLDDLVLAEIAAERPLLTVDASRVSAAQVVGVRGQLARVVRNLLLNAAAHAQTVVAVALVERDGHAVLTVEDDGPGIPPERRDEVLLRFTRLDPSRQPFGHAGLGLAIVADIVARHHGRIEIGESALGGALVRVSLPLLGASG